MTNEIVIVGNLTKEPEMKYFESGKSVTNFSIAVNGYKNKEKTVTYYNCQLWDKEFVAEYCKKGDKIVVQGYLKKEKYQSKTGEEKEKHTVVVNRVGYDMACMNISGKIEKIEEREKLNVIKLVDNDATIYSFQKNLGLIPDLWVNVFGVASINNSQVEITAVKIDFERIGE